MKLCPKCHKQFSDDANFCPVCATRLGPSDAGQAAVDSLAARFELGEKLGGSRTGAVHRAADKQSGARVAVKTVAPAVAALPGAAQRLERELKQLERVSSPGVAKVLGSGKRAGANGEETWVAIEMLDGAQTLAEAITARGPIAPETAAHLLEVIGESLIEAAQVGVVHRDLAPKNVVFSGNDVKLINFSLPVPTTDKVPGVPEFVAPEQVDGKPVDQRSNLYNLGALYYYVLTGHTVVSGRTVDEVHAAITTGAITPPSQVVSVPAPVEQLIMRALDKSPTKRFLTVRQFVDEVTRVANGGGDARSTMPLGRAGGKRDRGELMQTLLGVRDGSAPVQTRASAIASAPTQAGVSTLQPAVAAVAPASAATTQVDQPVISRAPTPNPLKGTLVGSAAGQAPSPAVATAAPNEATEIAPIPVAHAPSAVSAVSGMVPIIPPTAAELASAATVVPPQPAVAAVAAAPAAPQAPKAPSSPVIATAPAGKKKSPEEKESKGKFRETMWFKKGDLDSQAAVTAAEEREKGGDGTTKDKADLLPIEDRYKDDGSISRGDKEKYSLRTGATQMQMAAIKDPLATSQSANKVSEDKLIGEMKGGRNVIIYAIVGLVCFIIGLVFFLKR